MDSMEQVPNSRLNCVQETHFNGGVTTTSSPSSIHRPEVQRPDPEGSATKPSQRRGRTYVSHLGSLGIQSTTTSSEGNPRGPTRPFSLPLALSPSPSYEPRTKAVLPQVPLAPPAYVHQKRER